MLRAMMSSITGTTQSPAQSPAELSDDESVRDEESTVIELGATGHFGCAKVK